VLVVLTAAARSVEEYVNDALPVNVRCVGTLPFHRYQALLADCDVYLATMLESSGQGHLEALYMGKPVIGYRWGGAGELAGSVAVLVEPGDVDSLPDALDDALSRRGRLGYTGRQLVEDYHLWPDVAREYEYIYKELK
jgi:glycosyltransferase involved in cell wall biosynthesis